MPDKPIYVGKRSHTVRNVMIAAALCIVVMTAVLIVAPSVWDVPCRVTLNDTVVSTTTKTTIEELVFTTDPKLRLEGDLVDVAGQVIEQGKGDACTILKNGESASRTDTVRSGDYIEVILGEDRVEKTAIASTYIEPGYTRVGNGPMLLVKDPGAIGQTDTITGALSGKQLDEQQIVKARKPVVRYGNAAAVRPKVVALTFDDGPNPGETDDILRVLRSEGVKATFFVLGKQVERYPTIAKDMVDQGHQIASHSYSHTALPRHSASQIRAEVAKTRRVIEKATGVSPNWIRPPYGMVNGTVFTVLEQEGIRSALWTVEPRDWARPGKQAIINRVVFTTKPGSVVLFHDGGGDRSQTVRALRGIIGELRDRGYTFVTIEELDRLIKQQGGY